MNGRRLWWQRRYGLGQKARRCGERLWQGGQRLVRQHAQHAWAAGRDLARRIIGVQQSAQLPNKLMIKSAQSVLAKPEVNPADATWREGYKSIALQHVPGLAWELHADLDREAGG